MFKTMSKSKARSRVKGGEAGSLCVFACSMPIEPGTNNSPLEPHDEMGVTLVEMKEGEAHLPEGGYAVNEGPKSTHPYGQAQHELFTTRTEP